MKYIIKQPEPDSFTKWKKGEHEDWNPTWGDIGGNVKEELRKALIGDQGGICCYCGIRLTLGNNHIEHIRPRSKFLSEALAYENMLVSCLPGKKEDSNMKGDDDMYAVHCGMKKDDWYEEKLFISPLESKCERSFQFFSDGSIEPIKLNGQEDKPARTTIDKLGLDNEKLNKRRKKALEDIGIFDDPDRNDPLLINESDRKKLAEDIVKKDEDGNFTPYCFVISYVLRNYNS